MTELHVPAGVDRPLPIGDIFDRSITIAVRRWRTLFALVLVESLPVGIGRAFFPMDRGPQFLLWYLPDLALVALLSAAIVLAVIAPHDPGPVPMLRAAVRVFGRALGAWLLAALYFAWNLFVCALAGGILGIPLGFLLGGGGAAGTIVGLTAGGIVALGILPRVFLTCSIAVPNVVIDGVTASTAFTLARRRVRNAGFNRGWLLGIAVFAVVGAPALVISAAMDTVVSITHVTALRVLEEFITDVVSLGLSTTLATVVALELRLRAEGADLHASLDAASTVHV